MNVFEQLANQYQRGLTNSLFGVSDESEIARRILGTHHQQTMDVVKQLESSFSGFKVLPNFDSVTVFDASEFDFCRSIRDSLDRGVFAQLREETGALAKHIADCLSVNATDFSQADLAEMPTRSMQSNLDRQVTETAALRKCDEKPLKAARNDSGATTVAADAAPVNGRLRIASSQTKLPRSDHVELDACDVEVAEAVDLACDMLQSLFELSARGEPARLNWPGHPLHGNIVVYLRRVRDRVCLKTRSEDDHNDYLVASVGDFLCTFMLAITKAPATATLIDV